MLFRSAEGAQGREVLFAVGSMPTYGALSNRKLDEQIEGARVAVEAHKRNPADFVLWKESAATEPGWSAEFSEAGQPGSIYGRPGWHIECSAMSHRYLGETFDIHGGGIDLVFPHHENEIAQSCCAFGTPRMANVWMHNGFLQVEGQKMSKSLGNFVTIHELLETDTFGGRSWPGEVLRLAMLKTHYRQPIDFTVKALEEAEATLLRLYERVVDVKPSVLDQQVKEALLDDLNMPQAFVALFAIKDQAVLAATLSVLGFSCQTDQLREPIASDVDEDKIKSLIAARLEARRNKNFAESDRVRDELLAMGIQVKDGKDAEGNPVTTWEVKR